MRSIVATIEGTGVVNGGKKFERTSNNNLIIQSQWMMRLLLLDLSNLATINHSGTPNRGHYTSHVVDPANGSWWLCNDKAVTPVTLSNLSNRNSTVFLLSLGLFSCTSD